MCIVRPDPKLPVENLSFQPVSVLRSQELHDAYEEYIGKGENNEYGIGDFIHYLREQD